MADKKSEKIKIYIAIGLAIVLVISGYFRLIHAKTKKRGVTPTLKPSLAPITIPKIQTEPKQDKKQVEPDRFDFLLDEVRRTGAHGIIYTSLKFCDHFLVDYPALKEILDRRGIPSLFLEGEYFSFAAGQVKTRVEAFLELL